MARRSRHDSVAFRRQGYLARLLIVLNFGIGGLSAAIALASGWHSGLDDTGLAIFGGLMAVALASLGLAAGCAGGLRELFANVGTAALPPRSTPDFCDQHRSLFFYIGVYANVIALAVLVEATGGVVFSPFITAFFAFVLTGQQLARFKTQSGWLIVSGVVLTLGMLAYELANKPDDNHAPNGLYVALMLLALFAGGWLNHSEKGPNYTLPGQVEPPSHAHVYKDGNDTWHYSLYGDRQPLDPVLSGDGVPQLKKDLLDRIEEMATDAGWGTPTLDWPASQHEDFVVTFSFAPARGEALSVPR